MDVVKLNRNRPLQSYNALNNLESTLILSNMIINCPHPTPTLQCIVVIAEDLHYYSIRQNISNPSPPMSVGEFKTGQVFLFIILEQNTTNKRVWNNLKQGKKV